MPAYMRIAELEDEELAEPRPAVCVRGRDEYGVRHCKARCALTF